MKNIIYNKNALILITLLGLSVLFLFAYLSTDIQVYGESFRIEETIALQKPLANVYTINYVLDGGTNSPSNPTSVSSSSSNITLQPATKSGYKFLGWYKDSSFNNYIEKIKPSTMSGDLTLYAKFTPYISIPVKYLYTDFYSSIDDTKGYINCYYSYSAYYYENITSVASMVSGHSSYTVYSTANSALTLKLDEGEYYSLSSQGTPSYIRIASDSFYSITYALDGGSFKAGESPYNYYYTRANISSHELTPIKDGAAFMGWYLDSAFTTTYYSSSFTPSNITLYAKWSDIHSIDALFISTDFFNINQEIVSTIEYYEDDYDYIYSSNFKDLFDLHTDYTFTIYNASGDSISYYLNEGVYASSKSNGVPFVIKYNTPKIYSIQYVLGDGASIPDGKQLYNYYTKRADLKGNTVEPIKDSHSFDGWYLDQDYTSTIYNSSFSPSDITLYAKWSETYFAPVLFYDALSEEECTNLGNTYYYISSGNEYVLGDYSDTTKQLPYYFDLTGSDSYKVYSESGDEMAVYISEGYLLTKGESKIGYIKIYKHYKAEFYVNGEYVFESRGADNESIIFPDFVVGFIGPNYNAIRVGSFTIGKEYAIYIMKGWSLTDSSDITWLDETEISLTEETITYSAIANSEHNIKLYAYMTFYGKVNAVNSNINYDEYIATTRGLITKASPYSLDDFMLEHVTEISSGTQKSNLDKILKYFKLDNLGNSTLGLLNKILNGNPISFNDLWGNTIGKIIIFTLSGLIIAIALINIVNLVKALSKIQSNS